MIKDDFYTVEDLAELFRIKPNTIQSKQWALRGILCPVKVGKRLLFPKSKVEKLCQS